MHALASVLQ